MDTEAEAAFEAIFARTFDITYYDKLARVYETWERDNPDNLYRDYLNHLRQGERDGEANSQEEEEAKKV